MKYRSVIISLFFVLAIVSTYFSTQLKFSFSFEQFFPKGDPDLEFYKNFTKDFEADDNFLLIAVEHHPTVFDSAFLSEFHTLSLQLRDIPLITKVQSLTQVEYPVRTPFGYTMIASSGKSRRFRRRKPKRGGCRQPKRAPGNTG